MITPWSKQPQRPCFTILMAGCLCGASSVLLRLTCPKILIHAAAHPIILALIHTAAAAAAPISMALSSHSDHP
jgi:hypothetical protein